MVKDIYYLSTICTTYTYALNQSYIIPISLSVFALCLVVFRMQYRVGKSFLNLCCYTLKPRNLRSIFLGHSSQFRRYSSVNSSSHTLFNISGRLKIQTLLKVRQGQYKTFLLLWLCYFMSCNWDMAGSKCQIEPKNENWEAMIFFERWWPYIGDYLTTKA